MHILWVKYSHTAIIWDWNHALWTFLNLFSCKSLECKNAQQQIWPCMHVCACVCMCVSVLQLTHIYTYTEDYVCNHASIFLLFRPYIYQQKKKTNIHINIFTNIVGGRCIVLYYNGYLSPTIYVREGPFYFTTVLIISPKIILNLCLTTPWVSATTPTLHITQFSSISFWVTIKELTCKSKGCSKTYHKHEHSTLVAPK